MNNFSKTVSAIVLGLLVSACVGPDTSRTDLAPLRVVSSTAGAVLANSAGMTLYTHKDDAPGKSACYGRCARKWPPAEAVPGETVDGPLSIIERSDGKRQYAYNGKALYTWVKDKSPGDATGDKRGEVWFVARP